MFPQLTLCLVTSANLDDLLSVPCSAYAIAAYNLPLTVLVWIPLNPPSFNNAAASALPPTKTLKLTSGSQSVWRRFAGAPRCLRAGSHANTAHFYSLLYRNFTFTLRYNNKKKKGGWCQSEQKENYWQQCQLVWEIIINLEKLITVKCCQKNKNRIPRSWVAYITQ